MNLCSETERSISRAEFQRQERRINISLSFLHSVLFFFLFLSRRSFVSRALAGGRGAMFYLVESSATFLLPEKGRSSEYRATRVSTARRRGAFRARRLYKTLVVRCYIEAFGFVSPFNTFLALRGPNSRPQKQPNAKSNAN